MHKINLWTDSNKNMCTVTDLYREIGLEIAYKDKCEKNNLTSNTSQRAVRNVA